MQRGTQNILSNKQKRPVVALPILENVQNLQKQKNAQLIVCHVNFFLART